MSRRGLPALVLFLVAVAALVVVGRDRPGSTTPVFADEPPPWMPAVGSAGELTGTWFCPGVPATGEEGVGGEVVVANPDDSPLPGRFTVLTDAGVATERTISVEPWSRTTIDVAAYVTADFAAVVVELADGRGLVEQRAVHPAGVSVAPCSTETSEEWYLADGFTLDGSLETLVLTNPFDEAAVADLRFATTAGESEPNLFQGFTIAPRSVRTWLPLFDATVSATAMDGLNRLFSNDWTLVRTLRDAGLGVVERLPQLKRTLVAQAAGTAGELPRLLRGELA